MGEAFHNVFVGSETGLVKGVYTEKSDWNNLNTLSVVKKENEICCMSWTDATQQQFCVGLQGGTIQVYSRLKKEWTEEYNVDIGSGRLRGLIPVESGGYVTAVQSGTVRVWNDLSQKFTSELDACNELYCISQSHEQMHLFATGGKENDVKIWDFNKPDKPVFRAKNVCHDWLNLRVPVWVTGVEFIPGTQKIVTCTGYHQIRVYDPSTNGRRPVLNMEFDEYPFTSMCLMPGGNEVMVGNTHGLMALMDLRKGEMVQCYKGFAGSVRCIKCHPTLPLVASCGLDRYLRVHDIRERHLTKKIYLKSRLSTLLICDKWMDESVVKVEKSATETTEIVEEKIECSDTEMDTLWESLPVVNTKTVKRKQENYLLENIPVDNTKTVKRQQENDSPDHMPKVKVKSTGSQKEKKPSKKSGSKMVNQKNKAISKKSKNKS